MGTAYRRALFCGALPLAVGLATFVLWVLTRWDDLMLVGVGVIVGGLVFLLGGTFELIRFVRLGLRAPDLLRRRLWLRAAACGALLLSNLPVAGGIVVAAEAIESCYTVEVRNDSGEPVEGVRVAGPGCDASFGTIRSGDTSRRRLWAKGNGSLVLEIGGKEAAMIEGYVCTGWGGRATATIGSDGTIAVHRRR